MESQDASFDVFSMPEGTSLEEQRAFEIFWRKYTGRSCVVVSGVEYLGTLDYLDNYMEKGE